MKKIISLAATLALLLSLCACGDEGPTKPIAIRYNGEIISVYSTGSQLSVILGAPTRTEKPIANSSRTDNYYLGSNDRFIFNDSGLYSIYIVDDKFDLGGLKVGDSLSKAQKYLSNILKETDTNKYECSIVNGEVQPIGYMEAHGVEEGEGQKVVILFEADKIKSFEITRIIGKLR